MKQFWLFLSGTSVIYRTCLYLKDCNGIGVKAEGGGGPGPETTRDINSGILLLYSTNIMNKAFEIVELTPT